MFSDSLGDVAPGSVGGLVHEDTRFVSRWELRLDGAPLSLLKSEPVDYDSAAFFLTNADSPSLPATASRCAACARGRRRPRADRGLQHDVEPVGCELRLGCADFADLFEIKSGVRDRSGSIVASAGADRGSLRFRYQVHGFLAETTVRFARSQIVETATDRVVTAGAESTGQAVWVLDLPPRSSLRALVKVGVRVNNVTFEPAAEGFGGGISLSRADEGMARGIPGFESDSALLTNVFRQSVVDLAALRVTGDLLGELRPARCRAPVVHDPLRAGHSDHVAADALGRPGLARGRFICSAPCGASTSSGTRNPADPARGPQRRADAAG